ncbi:MAG TPA: sulfite exporter TauE/SafE family protein [Nocardioidaceae bacterium]|nr:sulfite exporter TauE/SafE family protein [Nocardioidaceae bacterium]
MLTTGVLLATGASPGLGAEAKTALAAFVVGIIVGITGMGGGALMTPALIFLGVGSASTVVTADLTASAVSRSAGAAVHWRQGSPNLRLAGWLVVGSVPMAFLGPRLLTWLSPPGDLETLLKLCIGFALLFAATTYAVRQYLNLRKRARHGPSPAREPQIRPVPTLVVGMLGGLLVGVTSVGAGSVIMIAMLLLYPTLSAVKLVGTDLVQAVPLVIAAAVSNILVHGVDWWVTVPLIIGSLPGTFLGAKLAPRVSQSLIRRGLVIILTVSGLTLLDQASVIPFGSGGRTHPIAIALIGLGMVALGPVVWGALRRSVGLPMFGPPPAARAERMKVRS